MAVGNDKSWRRISVSWRRRVGGKLVVAGAPTVVHLHRSVVRVAHVHRADYRRCWRVLESLVSQKTRWVLSVCHCLSYNGYCLGRCPYQWGSQPELWNWAEVGESLGSSGSLWRGNRARHCCHFSQDCNINMSNICILMPIWLHIKLDVIMGKVKKSSYFGLMSVSSWKSGPSCSGLSPPPRPFLGFNVQIKNRKFFMKIIF